MDLPSTLRYSVVRYDRAANEFIDYLFTFYNTATGHEIELSDTKTKRTFLKRTSTNIRPSQLYLGGTLVINSFQFTIVNAVDAATNEVVGKQERTLAVIHGSALRDLGKILLAANSFGFIITNMKSVKLLKGTQAALAKYGVPINSRERTMHVGIELMRKNSVAQWNKLREQFENVAGVYGARDVASAQNAIALFFGPKQTHDVSQSSAECSQRSALCLIKPHAVAEGKAANIVKRLQQDCEITAIEQVQLTKEDGSEFLECYKEVLGEYRATLAEITSGPTVAVEVCGDDIVAQLRKIAGPYIIEIARALAPNSIRAKFGNSDLENAVHVTDLAIDGKLECNFFFRVLKT